MYVSLQDLGIFLVVITALAVGVFLVITLYNANKLVSNINRRITDNNENIKNFVNNLGVATENISVLSVALRKNQDIFENKIPESINNFHAITTTLKHTSERVDNSINVVNASLMETAATVKENSQDVLTYIKIVSEGIRLLIDTFKNR